MPGVPQSNARQQPTNPELARGVRERVQQAEQALAASQATLASEQKHIDAAVEMLRAATNEQQRASIQQQQVETIGRTTLRRQKRGESGRSHLASTRGWNPTRCSVRSKPRLSWGSPGDQIAAATSMLQARRTQLQDVAERYGGSLDEDARGKAKAIVMQDELVALLNRQADSVDDTYLFPLHRMT